LTQAMKETSITLRDRSLRNTCRKLRGEKWQCLGRGCIDRLLCVGRHFLLLIVSLVEKRNAEVRNRTEARTRAANNVRRIRMEVFNRRMEEVFAKSITSMNSSVNSCFIYIFYQPRKSK